MGRGPSETARRLSRLDGRVRSAGERTNVEARLPSCSRFWPLPQPLRISGLERDPVGRRPPPPGLPYPEQDPRQESVSKLAIPSLRPAHGTIRRSSCCLFLFFLFGALLQFVLESSGLDTQTLTRRPTSLSFFAIVSNVKFGLACYAV